MGQSSIDLPDPMQVEGVQAVQNADDLLSQLAGNEIDRLLAENHDGAAEGEAESSVDYSGHDNSPQLSTHQQTSARDESPINASLADDAARQRSEDSSAELAEILSSSDGVKPSAAGREPDDEPERLSSADESSRVTDERQALADSSIEGLTGVSQTDLLGQMQAANEVELPDVLNEVLAGSAETQGRSSLVVRILDWVNSPFDGLDERTRSLLGKVAIVTLINAVAAICYILFWRGRGG